MREQQPCPADSVCMVTIHPTVRYYKCPVCPKTTTESRVLDSSDRQHNFHAVHHFTLRAIEHLTQVRGLTISQISQWTDGCAAQYKSKGPFSDVSCALGDLGATLERNFFGSRHGKSASDSESAAVKSHAARSITSGHAIIASAEDLFKYCQASPVNWQPPQGGCSHSSCLRTFFWGCDDKAVKTVGGTRTFHAVRCVEQNVIMSRHLTCCCQPCQTAVGDCDNSAVGPWSSQRLRTNATRPVIPGASAQTLRQIQ